MKRSILVMSRKGGVAKSTTSILLANGHDATGHQLRLIDADSPAGADKKAAGASFAGVFGARVERFVITPDVEKIKADVNAITQHWYPLFDAIVAGDCLIDFGANINEAFFAAWEAAGVNLEIQDAGTALDVVIPITVHPEALSGGLEAVSVTMRQMPGARIFVALVEKDGTFERFEGHPVMRELFACAEKGVQFFKVPRCVSTLWAPLELARMDYRTATLTPPEGLPELAARLGMGVRDARVGYRDLGEWYAGALDRLMSVGLIPQPAAKGGRKA